MEQLIQEAVVTVPRALIGETIDMVAVLAGRGSERRLAELARVDGLGPAGDFALTHLPCPSPVSAAPVATALSAGERQCTRYTTCGGRQPPPPIFASRSPLAHWRAAGP